MVRIISRRTGFGVEHYLTKGSEEVDLSNVKYDEILRESEQMILEGKSKLITIVGKR